MTVPESRVRALNGVGARPDREYVLYWMVAARRTRFHPGLEHAAALAREHGVPLVVFEALRAGYRWASHRHHRFVLDGMEANERRCRTAGVRYLRYVEPEPGAGRGLLEALAARATTVVTDDWPGFFVPAMQRAVAARLDVCLCAVDSNGVLPLSATERAYPTAASFRRHLQKTVLDHLEYRPTADPLVDLPSGAPALPDRSPWPSATGLDGIPIDGTVVPTALRGGAEAGARVLSAFLAQRLDGYPDRNHPDADTASGLSPYLHHGHVGALEVFWEILDRSGWSPDLPGKATGSRGWWRLPEPAEAFVDELVTWRELGQVFAHHRPEDYDRYASVPDWARQSLDVHATDPRELVPLEALEHAQSPDPLWNAAQRQLLEDGIVHNYLRMLWGKKLLAWTEHPEVAFEWLTHLNNKYALDGRDPNSASGIAWVFGRHDRAWGPERPIYGKVRYMTSASTRRKLKLAGWLDRYGT